MPRITYPEVNNIITNNGELFIPDSIEDAILNCIVNPLDIVAKKGSELKDIFSPVGHAVNLDYSSSVVIDAYSLFYMRRNILIPRIAMRDIILNKKLQKFPDKIKVLDIGTGTGAVVVGLLEMFLHEPFKTIEVTVDAIDAYQSCLDRLRCHLKAAGLSKFQVNTLQVDISDIQALDDFLSKSGPYDFIFAGNVFNEILHEQSCDTLRCLSKHLAETAVIIIASAQRDFIKQLQPLLSKEAIRDGLFIYYPCAGSDTSNHDCWI